MGSDRSTLSSLHASDTLRHAAVSVGLAEWSCVLNYLVLIKLSYKIDELFKKIFFSQELQMEDNTNNANKSNSKMAKSTLSFNLRASPQHSHDEGKIMVMDSVLKRHQQQIPEIIKKVL